MRINVKEFLKNRESENSSPENKKRRVRKILMEFEKEDIDFCILRNYENLEKEKDVDLLVEKNKKVDKIMNKFGLRRRYSYGYFMSYKGEGLWFDFKVGWISYHGFRYKSSEDILNSKKKYKYFYVLGEEDEFVHLILHCILHKTHFKEKYKRRLEFLLKRIYRQKVLDELTDRFEECGTDLFDAIKNKRYDKALALKDTLFFKMFRLRDLPTFFLLKLVWFFGGNLRKVIKGY